MGKEDRINQLQNPVDPEDPFGTGIEGEIERQRSFFFPQTSTTAHDNQTALVPIQTVAETEFPEYTFIDIKFKPESFGPGFQHPESDIVVRDVIAIPGVYDQLKARLEARGLREGHDPNKGESFSKVDEVVLDEKPDIITFPKRTGFEHLFGDILGWGQYLVLCGEQVDGGEKVTLVELRRGIFNFPQPPFSP